MSKAKPIEKVEAEAGPVVDNVVNLRKRTTAERRESVIAFVKDHPGIAIAGGLAAGALVAALLPRRPLRKAAKRSAVLSEALAASVAALGEQAISLAGSAGSTLSDSGKRAAHRSEDLGASAVKHIGAFVRGLLDQAEELGGDASSRAEEFGKGAAKRLTKAGAAAEDAAILAGRRIGKAATDARSRIIG